MQTKIITLTDEEFDLFVQLMYTINQDKDGSFFICEEAADLIQDCNDLIDRIS